MAFSTLKGIIDADYSGVRDATDGASDNFDSLSDSAHSTGRSMQRAGGLMTAGITAPLTAMGAMSASVAADFDQNMQQSIAVMGDVDDAMREKLEQRAREVARTTTVSAEESAEAYYFLASAGLEASEAIEAMPQVAEFAEAGQMDMAEATDVATNVMSAFGYEAEEMTEVTDRMTATVSNHNQTMEGMSDALSRVAPTAAGAGIELEEVNAAIGQLGDVGIQGQRAGTALNTAISQMTDKTSPAAQEMEEMGVQVKDAEGNMLPLVEIFEQFEEAGADSSDMARIFGTQAGPAMAALVDQGADALDENTQSIGNMEGATEEMAETQRDTLNAEMQIARSNVADLGIAIGGELVPMISTLTAYVSGAAERFQGLSDRQRTTIVVVGGLVAAIGPLLMVAGTMLTMLPAMASGWAMVAGAASGASLSLQGVRAAILGVYTALGPIGALLIGISLAASALYAAWQTDFMGIRDTTTGVVNTILEAVEGLIDYVNEIPGVDIDWEAPEVDFSDEEDEAEEGAEGVEEAFQEGFDEQEYGLDEDELHASDYEFDDEYDHDFEQEGLEAGQDFGGGFGSGVVDSLSARDVTSHFDDEIDDAESNLEELEEKRGNAYGDEYMETLEEIEEEEARLEELQEQREEVGDADSIADVDAEILAEIAEEQQQQNQAEEERRDEVRELLGEPVEESDEDSESDLGGKTAIGEAEADAMLEESSGSNGHSEKVVDRLDSLLEKHDSLRGSLESLRLRVELGIDSREFNKIIDDRAEAVVEDTLT